MVILCFISQWTAAVVLAVCFGLLMWSVCALATICFTAWRKGNLEEDFDARLANVQSADDDGTLWSELPLWHRLVSLGGAGSLITSALIVMFWLFTVVTTASCF